MVSLILVLPPLAHAHQHCTRHLRTKSVAVEAGMMATIIESPDILQRTIRISQSALDICKEQGIPTAGNCAGNTIDVLDNSECNNLPSSEDWG
jgi:hypothetical protein